MGSIRYRPRKNSSQVVSEEAFDELRDASYERLQAEHAQLMTLAAALAPAEETTSWAHEELVLRAHRLRGRAALFERRTALAKLVRLVATMPASGPDDCGAHAG
jgi:hypothetical protein